MVARSKKLLYNQFKKASSNDQNNMLAFSVLVFFHATAQNKVLWQIGKADNSAAEFALAPDQYKNFVAGFGGENSVYYVGYSKPDKHWSYVLPGPLDSWAGGGYWSGYFPRHFFRIFFNIDFLPSKGMSRLKINFADVNNKNPPLLRVEINGHWKQIQLTAGNGKALDGLYTPGNKQSVVIDIPPQWLKKDLTQFS